MNPIQLPFESGTCTRLQFADDAVFPDRRYRGVAEIRPGNILVNRVAQAAVIASLPGGPGHLVYHPAVLALGVGCERGCPPEELEALVRATLAEAGLAPEAVGLVVSLDLKADERAVLDLAEALGVPARFFAAERLEEEAPRLATPSEAVFREVGLSRNESAQLVESVLDHMSDALVEGETVKISSFGTFSVREKAARVGRNPKTGEEVPISPRRVLTFRPSHLMKDRVSAGNKG